MNTVAAPQYSEADYLASARFFRIMRGFFGVGALVVSLGMLADEITESNASEPTPETYQVPQDSSDIDLLLLGGDALLVGLTFVSRAKERAMIAQVQALSPTTL